MKFIEHLDGLISSKINSVKGLWTLFKLEAKLAGLTVLPVLISVALLSALAITMWLTTMVFLGCLLHIYGTSLLASIGFVLVLNCCLLLLVGNFLKRGINKMSFSKTRSCLRASNNQGDNDESREQIIGLDSLDR